MLHKKKFNSDLREQLFQNIRVLQLTTKIGYISLLSMSSTHTCVFLIETHFGHQV